jgi:hypothetical protein
MNNVSVNSSENAVHIILSGVVPSGFAEPLDFILPSEM